MNPICITAALLGSRNYNTLPREPPHLLFLRALPLRQILSNRLRHYAYEFATACRRLFILFPLLACRRSISSYTQYAIAYGKTGKRIRPQLYAVYLHSFHLLEILHEGHLRTENKMQTSRYSHSCPWYLLKWLFVLLASTDWAFRNAIASGQHSELTPLSCTLWAGGLQQ